MIENKVEYIKALSEACKAVCSTESIEAEIDELLQEIEVVTEMKKKFITENADEVQDRDGYTNRYNALEGRYERAKIAMRSLMLLRKKDFEKAER